MGLGREMTNATLRIVSAARCSWPALSITESLGLTGSLAEAT